MLKLFDCLQRRLSTAINSSTQSLPPAYEQVLRLLSLQPDQSHSVLILQPDVKHGSLRRHFVSITNFSDRKFVGPSLDEARALVDSIPGWTSVVAISFKLKKMVQPNQKYFMTKGIWNDLSALVTYYSSNQFEESGQLQEPTNTQASCQICYTNPSTLTRSVTAVFVNWSKLSPLQIQTMQNTWSLPVYDRYSLIILLFNTRAQSPDARLQSKIAEISLIRKRLPTLYTSRNSIGEPNFGFTHFTQIDQMLKEQETHLLKQVNSVEKQRCIRSEKREAKHPKLLPVVSVVGYTNAGKTSLIRCLSEDKAICSSPQVFATLDLTRHHARLGTNELGTKHVGLPGLQLSLLDTVGFMADLPNSLVAAFEATLRECLDTDLILHVVDISEPDWNDKRMHVDRMLSHTGIQTGWNAVGTDLKNDPSIGRIRAHNNAVDPPRVLYVANKADCGLHFIDENTDVGFDAIISAEKGFGILDLQSKIGVELLQRLGWFRKTVLLKQGSSSLEWLYSNALVTDISVYPMDVRFIKISAIFTRAVWNKLNSQYQIRRRNSNGIS